MRCGSSPRGRDGLWAMLDTWPWTNPGNWCAGNILDWEAQGCGTSGADHSAPCRQLLQPGPGSKVCAGRREAQTRTHGLENRVQRAVGPSVWGPRVPDPGTYPGRGLLETARSRLTQGALPHPTPPAPATDLNPRLVEHRCASSFLPASSLSRRTDTSSQVCSCQVYPAGSRGTYLEFQVLPSIVCHMRTGRSE